MLLALDTSAERGSLALFDGERLIAETWLDAGERHAASLLVCLDRLLAQSKRTLAEVDRIALSIGPGSFTGLRIGLASALGLAFGTERRLVPVPTLAALATQAGVEDRAIAPVLDARRGEVYAGLYRADGTALREDSCSSIADFLASLPAHGPIAFLGGGVGPHRAAFAASLGARAEFLPDAAGCLRAASVGRLGARLDAAGLSVDPERVELRYLRRAEAEAKRLALHPRIGPIP
ncbi:MAG: tRNA (adenosine(37)-N6)-threonylcarbamoyltransferase complex dimerization subunit type 1 TsaB [Myxococcota bacterium]